MKGDARSLDHSSCYSRDSIGMGVYIGVLMGYYKGESHREEHGNLNGS